MGQCGSATRDVSLNPDENVTPLIKQASSSKGFEDTKEDESSMYALEIPQCFDNCRWTGELQLSPRVLSFEKEIARTETAVVASGVYKHEHTVCVKTIPRRQRAYFNPDKAVFTECDILNRLSGNPCILQIVDLRMDRENYYIMTDLCDFDLYSEMKRVEIPFNEMREITFKLVDAIHFMHSNNVIHRDIKPENIVFKKANRVHPIIIDFGESFLITEENKNDYMTEPVGSLRYMSPEKLSPKYTVEECKMGDMWAIGAIAYEMITDRSCFQGQKRFQIISNIKENNWNRRLLISKNVSIDCKEFITNCLNSDIKQRITPQQGLTHPFFNSSASSALASKNLE